VLKKLKEVSHVVITEINRTLLRRVEVSMRIRMFHNFTTSIFVMRTHFSVGILDADDVTSS